MRTIHRVLLPVGALFLRAHVFAQPTRLRCPLTWLSRIWPSNLKVGWGHYREPRAALCRLTDIQTYKIQRSKLQRRPIKLLQKMLPVGWNSRCSICSWHNRRRNTHVRHYTWARQHASSIVFSLVGAQTILLSGSVDYFYLNECYYYKWFSNLQKLIDRILHWLLYYGICWWDTTLYGVGRRLGQILYFLHVVYCTATWTNNYRQVSNYVDITLVMY